MKNLCFVLFLSTIYYQTAFGKVYHYVKVAPSQEVMNLEDFRGQSFLSFMKEAMYPALESYAKTPSKKKHFQAMKAGEGVELRLTENITTYHMKYKAYWEENAERSGRSYAAVDSNPWNKKTEYVADASYKHYLSSLQSLLEKSENLVPFYRAVFMLLTNCDPSGLRSLSVDAQQVAADFLAVYAAEQYRHLISGKGKYLGPRHQWDDAHLQVTLLAAFHAGQEKKRMFYQKRWVAKVYHQKDQGLCIYQRPNSEIPKNYHKRNMNLTDYWQFNKECLRSGVNITRRDFQKLGNAITPILFHHAGVKNAQSLNRILQQKWTNNIIGDISGLFISNSAPKTFDNSEEIVEEFVEWILLLHDQAPNISWQLSQ